MTGLNHDKTSRIKALFISSIAIILEWYDFLIFGFYAVFISKLFFPFQDQTTSLITTFLIFGISFLFRPLGAVVVSHIGDKYGRKNAFILTVILMTLPTFLIGVLPTYSQIGIAAPVLIILLRIMQGFSLGGERSSTLSILVEMAPKNSRGLYVVFAGFSTMVGIILASLVCGYVSSKFTFSEMLSFGWRIPFLLGIFTGVSAYFLRRNLSESTKFLEVKSSDEISETPLKEAVRDYWKQIIVTLFGTLVFAVSFYVIFVYLITFSVTVGKMELSEILKMNTINMIIGTAFLPFLGHLSDKIGRKPLMILGAAGTIISSFFLFKIFSGDDYQSKFIIQFVSGMFQFVYAAGLYPFMVELFPTKIRMTALSLGHVMGFSIFGGSAPLITAYLIGKTGNVESGAYYLVVCAIISLFAVLTLGETYKKDLR